MAFGHNVATEMKAGRPQKQALAISYSEKDAAERGKKKGKKRGKKA